MLPRSYASLGNISPGKTSVKGNTYVLKDLCFPVSMLPWETWVMGKYLCFDGAMFSSSYASQDLRFQEI